ncbi:hypothetical protein BaRGS_00004058, partial [Batillaria attramentaria]
SDKPEIHPNTPGQGFGASRSASPPHRTHSKRRPPGTTWTVEEPGCHRNHRAITPQISSSHSPESRPSRGRTVCQRPLMSSDIVHVVEPPEAPTLLWRRREPDGYRADLSAVGQRGTFPISIFSSVRGVTALSWRRVAWTSCRPERCGTTYDAAHLDILQQKSRGLAEAK